MKTIEFKIRLNQSRIAQAEEWLEGCRRIWNLALGILEENQQWAWREKSGMTDDPHPVPWRWIINDVDGQKVFALCCDITVGRDHRPACPIKRTPGNEPPDAIIRNKDPYMTLTGIFAARQHPDKPWLQSIPSDVVRGTLRSLADAWKEYRRGKRNRTQFKPKHKPLKSLSCNVPVKVEGDRVRFPKLGWLTCKTLPERWTKDVTPKVIKLVRRASGWYVQLTGAVPPIWKAKPSNIACGLDVGLEFLVADDIGNVVEPPKYYRKAQKRLRRLQRKRSRQIRGSGKEKKTKQLIARTHERIADQRSRFNHKRSTFIVQTFGGIAVEDIKIANLTRRPKPKLKEDGAGYERNGAAAKSGLNKSFADAGIGQLLTMIEQKSKVHNREFLRVAPHYTSQDCPQCGNRVKKSLSQRTHLCANCGYSAGRDHAAAQNIKAKAEFQSQYRRSGWELGETAPQKPVEPDKVQALKRERTQVRLCGDSTALQPTSQQLSLNLDVLQANGSNDSHDVKTFVPSVKSSEPRGRGRKVSQSKASEGQGLLSLWDVG